MKYLRGRRVDDRPARPQISTQYIHEVPRAHGLVREYLINSHRREVVAVREGRDEARRAAVVDERPVQQEDEKRRREREVLEHPRRFRKPRGRRLGVAIERGRRRVRGEGQVDDLDDEHLVREVDQVAPLNMRHAPDEHGQYTHEQAHSDGEVRFVAFYAAAGTEVFLPPIVVGRERESLAPGRHCCARRLSYFDVNEDQC